MDFLDIRNIKDIGPSTIIDILDSISDINTRQKLAAEYTVYNIHTTHSLERIPESLLEIYKTFRDYLPIDVYADLEMYIANKKNYNKPTLITTINHKDGKV